MSRRRLNIVDDIALSELEHQSSPRFGYRSHADWIRMLRTRLRMTQAQLARRAHMSQPHLAGIERGKVDPQISTLMRIYNALSCDISFEPRPRKPVREILRGQARSVALKRLKQSMGSMALEGQAPSPDIFKHVLEARTDEIVNDPAEDIWAEQA